MELATNKWFAARVAILIVATKPTALITSSSSRSRSAATTTASQLQLAWVEQKLIANDKLIVTMADFIYESNLGP